MRPLLVILLSVVLALAALGQPDRTNLYSVPAVPPRDVLERLNLRLAWSVLIPVEGRRDGLLSVQLAPIRQDGKVKMRLLVQTKSSVLSELDAETGQTLWTTRVGRPYTGRFAPGFNNRDVFAERGIDLYGVSRQDGEIRWKIGLRGPAVADVLADSRSIYVNNGSNEIDFYDLPTQGEIKPTFFRSHRSLIPLQLRPVQTERFVIYPSPPGSVVALFKDTAGLYVRYQTEGTLPEGPGVHEADASVYIASRDGNVYGYSLAEGEQAWRFPAGAPLDRTPFVNDEDVFATADRIGLFRVRRRTLSGAALVSLLERRGLVGLAQLQEVVKEAGKRAGDPAVILTLLRRKGYLSEAQQETVRYRGGEGLWNNRSADRVLAVNPKFVYAMDRVGRLLVIDRQRGRELSRYDLRDYPVPVTNELTDRIYLAANNGRILCLHDRDYANPERMKRLPEPAPGTREAPARLPER
jgi:hypothetical protein